MPNFITAYVDNKIKSLSELWDTNECIVKLFTFLRAYVSFHFKCIPVS